MATLPQLKLFRWQEVEASSELARLELVLAVIPDERFVRRLEAGRGKGRDDYPVRPTWNALIAGIVFQHGSAASLLRELRRNGELRQACGFDPVLRDRAVPSDDAFGRFLEKVIAYQDELQRMVDEILGRLTELLPDLGVRLAVDSKGVRSFGNPVKDPMKKAQPDGRRDTDADVGVKTYRGRRANGSAWEKVRTWFGYKLHLLVDSTYELPLSFKVTRASVGDGPELPGLLEQMEVRHPALLARARECSADKAYEGLDNHRALHVDYRITPIIDLNHHWPADQPTRALYPDRVTPFVYDERGGVYCVCPASGEMRAMAFHGYDKSRDALKYRCPAAALGLTCGGRAECERGHVCGTYGRVVWIPLARDPRRFVRIPRHTDRWQKAYDHRSAIERVNSRVDRVLGFELHTIRGIKKMRARLTLGLLVMLCMALGRIEANQIEHLRSFVLPVARAA